MWLRRNKPDMKSSETVFLPQGTKANGHWNCTAPVRIGGIFEGRLECAQILLVEAQAEIHANVWARNAVIHGLVDGDLFCHEQLLLHKTARVTGSITVPPGSFVMQEGAVVQGAVRSWAQHQAERSKEVLMKLSRQSNASDSQSLPHPTELQEDPEALVEQSLAFLV
jgi:cytoskeletal protein CcmA (bactofilin family)